ncbi:hypothetical protein ABZ671_01660 [Micromonospora sp. NPDC006766]|uniref:hypothetical protein n=1 Tax=Micromonospora sp. NPDC006766 TaxID=3154778 RepID=UPI0033D42852
MAHPTQQHATTATRRALLLLGLAAASTGAALLATSGHAHAADRQPSGLLGAVTGTITGTVEQVTDTITPARGNGKTPVRDLLNDTTTAVDTTLTGVGRTVEQVTDTIDHVTAPIPVVGGAVDTVTDVTDRLVGTTPPTPSKPPDPAPPPVTDVTTPPDGDGGTAPPDTSAPSTTVPETAPETAPETTPGATDEQPPPAAAAPGAPIYGPDTPGRLDARPGANRAAAAGHTSPRMTAAHIDGAQPQPAPGNHRATWPGCDTEATNTIRSISKNPCAHAGRWAQQPRRQQRVTVLLASLSSRAERPAAPSG